MLSTIINDLLPCKEPSHFKTVALVLLIVRGNTRNWFHYIASFQMKNDQFSLVIINHACVLSLLFYLSKKNFLSK